MGGGGRRLGALPLVVERGVGGLEALGIIPAVSPPPCWSRERIVGFSSSVIVVSAAGGGERAPRGLARAHAVDPPLSIPALPFVATMHGPDGPAEPGPDGERRCATCS